MYKIVVVVEYQKDNGNLIVGHKRTSEFDTKEEAHAFLKVLGDVINLPSPVPGIEELYTGGNDA